MQKYVRPSRSSSLKSAINVALALFLSVSFVREGAAESCNCEKITVPPVPEDVGPDVGLQFTHTPAYHREFHSAVSAARKFCENYRKEHATETNLAIVFDIDETLLDNRPEVERNHDPHDWTEFDRWIRESKAKELKPTANLLRWARRNGFSIFLITGRPEADRKATIINLVRVQLPYDGLYLRDHHGGPPAEIYKSAVRANLEEMGFKIVENIGDQYSDLAGGHSLDCQKLPNKMYFIR
jgi:hypothetical protein